MSISTYIEDPATSQKAAVLDNALQVIVHPYPTLGAQKIYPFRQYLTADGTPGGAFSMKVNGTLAAPVKFWVGAPQEDADDRYITALSFVVAGATPLLNQFAAIAALTNGCKLYYSQSKGNRILHDSLKSNFDLVRLCFGNPAIGATTNAFYASNVVGTAEAYIPVLDLTRLMPPYGIKLDAQSDQKLILEVRDNLTVAGVVAFDVIAYGFERTP